MKKNWASRALALALSAALFLQPGGVLAEEIGNSGETIPEAGESVNASEADEGLSSGEAPADGEEKNDSSNTPENDGTQEAPGQDEEEGSDAGEDPDQTKGDGREETEPSENNGIEEGEEGQPEEGDASQDGESSGNSKPSQDGDASQDGENPKEGEDDVKTDSSGASSDNSSSETPEEGGAQAPDPEAPSENAVEIASFDPLPEDESRISVSAGLAWDELELPDKLSATGADGAKLSIEGVTWKSGAYSAEAQPGTEFRAQAVLPEGYRLAEGAALPELIVVNDAISTFAINDRFIIDGAIYKEIDPERVQLIGYEAETMADGPLTLPAKVTRKDGREFAVSIIEPKAFQGCEAIRSLVVGVPEIGSSAFEGCKNLTDVTFEESVRNVGNQAFKDCSSLVNISMEEFTGRFESYVFNGCGSLGTVRLPLHADMDSGVFSNSGVKAVEIPEGMESLPSAYLFADCKSLESVSLPSSMKNLSQQAFQGCTALKNVDLKNLTQINDQAFFESGLESVEFPSSVTFLGTLAFAGTPLKKVTMSDLDYVGYSVFQDCKQLREVTFQEGIKEIKNACFKGCASLEAVHFPQSLERIADSAFCDTGLKEVMLPPNMKELSWEVFRNCGALTSITIPDGMTTLGSYCLAGTGLTQITLPDTITHLGNNAFQDCQDLKAIHLPDSVTYLGGSAFQNCINLETVHLPEGLTSVEAYTFLGCVKLREVNFTANLHTIGVGAFQNCAALTKAEIPGVTTIDSGAFKGTGLMEISITGAKKLGTEAFGSCKSLIKAELNSLETAIPSSLFPDCIALKEIVITGILSQVEDNAFRGVPEDLIITVPDKAAAILVRDSGFDPDRIKLADGSNSGLIPASFTVGDFTYEVTGEDTVTLKSYSNSGAAEVDIPETAQYDADHSFRVTEIGDEAFRNNYTVTSVRMKENIIKIGSRAFESCGNLNSVTLSKSITEIPLCAFTFCTSLREIDIPEGVERIGESAFNSTGLNKIQLPSSLRYLEDAAFAGTRSMASIELPDGLTSIGGRAFQSSGLTEAALPDSVESCGNSLFDSCNSLRKVRFSSKLSYIPYQTFAYCPQLQEVVFPTPPTSIGSWAFNECGALREFPFAPGLEQVGYCAFYKAGLTDVKLPDSVRTIDNGGFANCASLRSIELGSGLTTLGQEAFKDCESLNSVAFPKTLSIIQNQTFQNCKKLESVTFAEGLSSIYMEAFYNTGLREITLPNSLGHLGTRAFGNCPLEFARVGNGLTTIDLEVFPKSTQLLAEDPRVQMLLVEYLHQDEDKRPASIWEGSTDIPPGAITAVEQNANLTVFGNLTVGHDAELTIYGTVTVTGSLNVEGTLRIAENGVLIVKDYGSVTGTDADVKYMLTIPDFANGSVSADKPFYSKGETVTLSVTPAQGYRLTKDSLCLNGNVLSPDADGRYTFQMPECVGTIFAQFENRLAGIAITGPESARIQAGEAVTYSAELPEGESADGIAFQWTAAPEQAVILSGANTRSVTVTGSMVELDTPVILTLTARQNALEQAVRTSLTVLWAGEQRMIITPAGPITLNPGATQQLTLTKIPGIGTPQWVSSDPKVASVDSSGLVTALSAGSTSISARSANIQSNDVTVKVTEGIIYAQDAVLDTERLTLKVNDTDTIGVSITPAEATVRGTWQSSDPAVASVDSGGKVQARAEGKAVLTYRIAAGAETDLIRMVEVQAVANGVTSVTINERPGSLFRPGDTLQLSAKVEQTGSAEGAVKWASSIPAVAEVDQKGLVTFHGAGKAVLTASLAEDPSISDSITLSAAVDVTGILRFPGGGKAPYKVLEATRPDGKLLKAYTDAMGAFRFEFMEAGTYQLTSDPYLAGYDILSQPMTVETGAKEAVWRLEYPACGKGSVEAFFADTSGMPVPGVRVALQCDSPYQYMAGYSGDDGKVSFRELSYSASGTPFLLNYSTNDGAYGSERVTLSSKDSAITLPITLAEVSVVTGRVADTTGRGIPDVYVLVSDRGAYTNEDGTYAIRGQLTPGRYPIRLGAQQKYFPVGDAPAADVTGSGRVEVPDFKVSRGIDVRGRLLLDGRTDSYGRAYITLYDSRNVMLAGGYASGTDGFGLDGVIKQPGAYRLEVANIYDAQGFYALDYEAGSTTFTVRDMSQAQVTLTLEAQRKLKTTTSFQGEGNALTLSTQFVQRNGKFDVTAKYRNNGGSRVTAVFDTILNGASPDPAYAGGDYGQLRHVVTLDPGQSGMFLIKALADADATLSVSAETKVTIDGTAYDFGRQTAEVANVTLEASATQVKPNERVKVYGESMRGSEVSVFDREGRMLGRTELAEDGGRWYSIELPGFQEAGEYQVYATASTETEFAVSEKVSFQVTETPVRIHSVQVDQLNYEDLPFNERVGVRAFSHTVDNTLRPDPLGLRTLFEGGDGIRSVTYHFAGLDFPASREADGSWRADFSGWRGTGIKRLTASIQTGGGSALELPVAEVTVLVDPSGRITDSDTGLPIPGAQVSCYVRNSDGSYSLWDSGRYAQAANPGKTNLNGAYGWMVPDGTYRITAEKEGYEQGDSGSLDKYQSGIDIPPPAMDVNLALIPETEMSLLYVSAENNAIHARFSRYVSTVNAVVTDTEGNTVPVTMEVRDDTIVLHGAFQAGMTYEVKFSGIRPKSGSKPSYSLAEASGTVTFTASATGPAFDGGASGQGSGSSGSGGSSAGSRKTNRTLFGVLSQMWSGTKIDLSPATVRKAAREGTGVLIRLSGTGTTGAKLAQALETLEPGETLLLRRSGNGRVAYQFTVDPEKLNALPEKLDFAVDLDAPNTRTLFEKYFTNRIAAFSLRQEGAYGFTAHLALQADAGILQVSKLYAYAYDPVKHQYRLLDEAKPWIDQNGYLHLDVTEGGLIVVTDGPLTPRNG